MLKAMRRNIQSLKPVLWIVVATFIVAIFAIWGGGSRVDEGSPSSTLVTIGGVKISGDTFVQTLRQRMDDLRRQYKQFDASMIQQLNIPQQVLEQLVQQTLLLQTARDLGLRVSDADIRERIKSYSIFQKDGQFVGFADYQKILDYNRIPVAEFEAGLRKDILITKVIELLSSGITVTEDEVWEAYRKQNETARIEYLVADASKMEAAKPTAAEVQAYFEKNKTKYRLPDRRGGNYVYIKTEDLVKEIKVEDKEVEAYYQENIAQFKEPEKIQVSRIHLPFTAQDKDAVLAQARDIQRRAQAGEDFAALARTYSKDDKAKDGGDWGLYDWKGLSAQETEAVSKLEQGQVSDLLELEAGAALLKVTEKTAESTKTLAEITPMVKGMLEFRKAQALAEERINRVVSQAKREKSLDAAAQKEGFRPVSTGPLKRGEAIPDKDTAGVISEALFGLQEGEISDLLRTPNGLAVVELKTLEAERDATLPEVQSQVETDLLEAAKKELAREKVLDARRRLTDKWDEVAAKTGLEYKSVEEHKREQYLSLVGESAEFDRLAFSLPLKEASEPLPSENGYALLRVLDRKTVTREDFDKVKATERTTLLEAQRNKFLQSYLVQAQQAKKVKVNYDLFLRLNSDILGRYRTE
ncbi:MAG: SurA N-terminal domain-containing protein [Candidatus Aminicenantes bacterium]|nr:SurA N-terminal domain-containing protein [Candidatus Aminicenantes bacterium]